MECLHCALYTLCSALSSSEASNIMNSCIQDVPLVCPRVAPTLLLCRNFHFHFLNFFCGVSTLTFLSVVCGDFHFHFMKFFCGAIYKSFEYILLNLWTQLKIFRTWWKEWHFLFSAAATWLNFQRQNLAFSGQRCKYGNTSSASQKDIRITTRICKYWTH